VAIFGAAMTVDQKQAMTMQAQALQPGRTFGAEGSTVVLGSIRTIAGRNVLADHVMGLPQLQLSSSGGLSITSSWSMVLRARSEQGKHLLRVQRRAA